MRFGDVSGLLIVLLGLAFEIEELIESRRDAGSHRGAVGPKHDELLAGARQNTAKIQIRPDKSQNWRRMQLRVNLHELDESPRDLTHVLFLQFGSIVSIKEQLGFQG